MAQRPQQTEAPADDGSADEAGRRARPDLVLGAAAATALVILALNNLGPRPGTGGPPVPDRTGLPAPTALDVAMVVVPALVGVDEQAAALLLDDRRLAPVVVHRFVACRPSGVVVEQDPPAHTRVPAGEAVHLVVTDPTSVQLTCPDGIALDQDRALVALVRDFGRGVAGARPPTAPVLSLSLRGASPAVTLAGREAQQVERWRMTPPGGGGDAAIPLLAPLVAAGDAYRVDVGPHRQCGGTPVPPVPEFAALRQVSITPTAADCQRWWALDLFLDEGGRIRAVNLDG